MSLRTKERSRSTTLFQKVHRVQNVKVENQIINKLKILSSDNGGEFTSKEFDYLFENLGDLTLKVCNLHSSTKQNKKWVNYTSIVT